MRAAKDEDVSGGTEAPDGLVFGLTVERIKNGIWLDGDVDMEGLADWLQRIMQQFDISGAWTVQASFMCNSVKAETCGGCAMIVTKDDVESMQTDTWIMQRLGVRGMREQDFDC